MNTKNEITRKLALAELVFDEVISLLTRLRLKRATINGRDNIRFLLVLLGYGLILVGGFMSSLPVLSIGLVVSLQNIWQSAENNQSELMETVCTLQYRLMNVYWVENGLINELFEGISRSVMDLYGRPERYDSTRNDWLDKVKNSISESMTADPKK